LGKLPPNLKKVFGDGGKEIYQGEEPLPFKTGTRRGHSRRTSCEFGVTEKPCGSREDTASTAAPDEAKHSGNNLLGT